MKMMPTAIPCKTVPRFRKNVFRPIGLLAWALALGPIFLWPARAAAPAAAADPPWLQAQPQDMEWWRAARFGLFVHWGPVSLKGTEIGWSRGGERRGHGPGRGQIPVEVYDNLYKEFNPTSFNARDWVA